MAHCLPSIDANMNSSRRQVEPELLDDLAPDDARAQRSRRDLRRVHRAMGSLSQLKRAIARLRLNASPTSIVELGAGDGTLLLRLAAALDPPWSNVNLTLLDRHDIVASHTRLGYSNLGWRVTVRCEDALDWAQQRDSAAVDLCISSLFLHHFDDLHLRRLLAGLQRRSDAVIACALGLATHRRAWRQRRDAKRRGEERRRRLRRT
jgi:SAM-dependent methyltransferase